SAGGSVVRSCAVVHPSATRQQKRRDVFIGPRWGLATTVRVAGERFVARLQEPGHGLGRNRPGHGLRGDSRGPGHGGSEITGRADGCGEIGGQAVDLTFDATARGAFVARGLGTAGATADLPAET